MLSIQQNLNLCFGAALYKSELFTRSHVVFNFSNVQTDEETFFDYLGVSSSSLSLK